jgi:hypothetical protein
MKPVPEIVTVVAFVPATTVLGLMEVTAGVGLFAGGGLPLPEEEPPPQPKISTHSIARPVSTHTGRVMGFPVEVR